MQLLTIGKNQAGQRLDKYLKKASARRRHRIFI